MFLILYCIAASKTDDKTDLIESAENSINPESENAGYRPNSDVNIKDTLNEHLFGESGSIPRSKWTAAICSLNQKNISDDDRIKFYTDEKFDFNKLARNDFNVNPDQEYQKMPLDGNIETQTLERDQKYELGKRSGEQFENESEKRVKVEEEIYEIDDGTVDISTEGRDNTHSANGRGDTNIKCARGNQLFKNGEIQDESRTKHIFDIEKKTQGQNEETEFVIRNINTQSESNTNNSLKNFNFCNYELETNTLTKKLTTIKIYETNITTTGAVEGYIIELQSKVALTDKKLHELCRFELNENTKNSLGVYIKNLKKTNFIIDSDIASASIKIKDYKFLINDTSMNKVFIRLYAQEKHKETKKENSASQMSSETLLKKHDERFKKQEFQFFNLNTSSGSDLPNTNYGVAPITYPFKYKNTDLQKIIEILYNFYCEPVRPGKNICIMRFQILEKISCFYELPRFLDMLFLVNMEVTIINVKNIVIVLQSFLEITKIFYIDDNAHLDKMQDFIAKSRLHILKFLQVAHKDSLVFRSYSHIIINIIHEKNIVEIDKKDIIFLYFAFFLDQTGYKEFKDITFFFDKKHFLVFYIFTKDFVKIIENPITSLFRRISIRRKFIEKFDRYISECFMTCHIKPANFKRIYYYLLSTGSIYLSNNAYKINTDILFGTSGFEEFILKCMSIYYEILKHKFDNNK